MSFKLDPKPPWYNKESKVVSINKIKMEDGILGKANKDGTIDINKNIKDTDKINQVISHEKVHLDQMQRGDLDYDDDNVIWKGKKYSRAKMDEGNKNLPWEKEAYTKMNKMEKFKLKGHRGNSTPFNNITQRNLVTPLNLDEDPERTKTKTNRKGETITVTKTKNPSTGRKTKTTNIKGPVEETTTPAPKPTTITLNTPETSEDFPVQPKQTITPGSSSDGDKKPFIKPLKKPGYKEAYNKTDKSIPFEEFEAKAIKWNKENPSKKTPPSLDIVRARPAKLINPATSHSLTIKGLPTKSTSTYEYTTTESKVKNNKKNKVTKYKQEKYCTPESTSVACLGGGKSDTSLLKPGKGGDGLQAKGFKKSNVSSKKNLRKVTSKKFVGFDQLGRNIQRKAKQTSYRIKTKLMGSGLV